MPRLLWMYLGLGLVKPEGFDAVAVIVLFCFLPYKFAGLRVHKIDEGLLSMEIEGSKLTVLGAYQHVGLIHGLIVFTIGIDCWPD